jgi:serine/threonine protein kinase
VSVHLASHVSHPPPSLAPSHRRFKKWIFTDYADALQVGKDPCYPSFFFPFHISPLARSLIVQLLHPDPTQRLSSTEAVKHRWLIHSTPLQRSNPRVGEENMHQGPISRQPSPNSSKVSGKPPLPSSRQTSPSQIASLLAYESVKQDSSIFIPTLSRDSSKNESSSAPGSKISLRHHSPESALSRPDLESGEVTDDSGPFPCSSPSAAVSVSALNMATLSLNSSIDPQQVVVVCVEDDGDCCVLDDSIWREMDDSATAASPHSETALSPAVCFSQSHSLHCSQNSLV